MITSALSRLWRAVVFTAAAVVVGVSAFATAAPAQASTAGVTQAHARAASPAVQTCDHSQSNCIPNAAQSCSTGEPKLDYEYVDSEARLTWSNVCGVGTWFWDGNYGLAAIKMASNPAHRVWLHQYQNGSGLSACFFGAGKTWGLGQYASWMSTPGNIQVSASTAYCAPPPPAVPAG